MKQTVKIRNVSGTLLTINLPPAEDGAPRSMHLKHLETSDPIPAEWLESREIRKYVGKSVQIVRDRPAGDPARKGRHGRRLAAAAAAAAAPKRQSAPTSPTSTGDQS